MQIGLLGYPQRQLDETQIDRCLETFILWLLSKTMFTEGHGDSINARHIRIAHEIAQAQQPQDIRQRSFGSAVLAATYRGMCNACQRNKENTALFGCPLLLQLWSWERFPVGRPDVRIGKSWYLDEGEVQDPVDAPTFATVWTRRKVSL